MCLAVPRVSRVLCSLLPPSQPMQQQQQMCRPRQVEQQQHQGVLLPRVPTTPPCWCCMEATWVRLGGGDSGTSEIHNCFVFGGGDKVLQGEGGGIVFDRVVRSVSKGESSRYWQHPPR